ncbi:MAG: deoxyribodipyrimidine photo-lyase [Mariniblastus sp.]|nr:deoxyribodipyrimidine photo-lyase [Mariniblastus sp.]
MSSLVWFRRDLRATDNKALFQAALEATDGLIGLFVITPQQWKSHDDADCKVKFWLDNLRELSLTLAKYRIPLRIETCDSYAEVPDVITKFAQAHHCDSLYFNREYEVHEVRRDNLVSQECESGGIAVRRFHDRVLVSPHEIKTKEGKFYSVFTPYRKVWETKVHDWAVSVGSPKKQPESGLEASEIPTQIAGFDFKDCHNDAWKPGEKAALTRLKQFSQNNIEGYSEARNIPSVDGTSFLSPYLAAGVISPRQCLNEALATEGEAAEQEGAKQWISELCWRDFYTHVMVAVPRVSMHQPFKLKTNALNWRTDSADFEAWANGQTGYPIVDAGMRQLNQTGWMHNRLRMVTAMFLTKHLLIDWRKGERYFMQKLIDGDLSANNGGWQWSASTGTDSVPYFRIFNPFSQSKRFDVEGAFIKQMCPELRRVPSAALHDPKKLSKVIEEKGLEYPDFVVDYKEGRERALAAFKSLT